jgi:hypothetical protein
MLRRRCGGLRFAIPPYTRATADKWGTSWYQDTYLKAYYSPILRSSYRSPISYSSFAEVILQATPYLSGGFGNQSSHLLPRQI